MPRQLGAADGGRCGRTLTLAGVVWGMLVSLAVAGPLEAYVAATDTTHLNWME